MRKVVFAGGCFWGVQAYFDTIKGVVKTQAGYANGNKENPSYKEVCSHTTGFAEVCCVEYDENKIELNKLLSAYFIIIDPTVLNRQGHDIGSQYRTGIYYYDENDFNIISKFIESQQKKYKEKIVTEAGPVQNFYPAEEYHQKYLEKNPGGYCHIPRELIKNS
ncbi:MAG: peptide-methionine (S)-S-oxide reductase MsrA [Bacillota bacterium]|nr:peptide-methionine (S)-S-oxide reductase MsrA [Bacillota bacterium]